MQSLFYFIIALSLLVVIHEYGHYWVARRCGVKVLKFSVGFGKALWSRTGKNGTEFVIAALPLGGYVKMLDSRETDLTEAEKLLSFDQQSLGKRVAIVSAGPAANLLFAILAYWIILVMGVPGSKPIIDQVVADSPAALAQLQSGDELIAINGKKTPTWNSVFQRWLNYARNGDEVTITVLSDGVNQEKTLQLPLVSLDAAAELFTEVGIAPYRPPMPAILGQVIADGAAAQAGLKVGDKLVSADDQKLDDWQSWVALIQASPDKTLQVSFLRDGQQLTLGLTPKPDEQGKGRIGAGVDLSGQALPKALQSELRYNPLAAMPEAVMQTWSFSANTVVSLWGMLQGSVSTKNLGGPISIAQFAGSSAQQGLISFIGFLAMISISLGILNLLPVPILDGGHLLMYFIEWVKGSPVSETVQMQGQKIGLILLLMLMFLAFANDLTRLFG
ncbi:MAG: RIP metalloprotease RseP [Methylophaga sp.]|nr:RIP metalloprotease RseP [Methylophaga sp.]